jgi:hypothetical protein
MKKSKIIVAKYLSPTIICLGLLMQMSCSKSFVNLQPYNSVPATGAVTNEASMYTALVGLYSSLRATDFYGRTYAIKGDLMSDNCFLSTANSGRYLVFNQFNMNKTDGYASNVWINSYAAIKNANLIINSGVANNTNNISQMLSEAYAIRGMVYFDLLRNFSLPYSAGSSNMGVPIVLQFDQSSKPKRDSISKGYAQVISDLTTAYSLAKFNQGTSMTFTSTGQTRAINSSYFTKYAIDGMLARVYQHIGNWAGARDAVLDIINNGGFSLAASTGLVSYWAGTSPRSDKVETMFEVTSDANNSVSDGTLANIYVPKPTGSYGDILATQTLYNSYSATDVRKGLYNPSTRSGQLGTAYYVTKYPIDNINFDDVKIVRYAETLLILAEAYYNLNDATNALKYLNMVAQKRDPSLAAYTITGPALFEQILTERQKELAFEGYRYWDFYRLQRSYLKPQAQDGTNAISSSIQVGFTGTSTVNIIFPIPNDEILANPNLAAQQNQGY